MGTRWARSIAQVGGHATLTPPFLPRLPLPSIASALCEGEDPARIVRSTPVME